MLSKLMATVKFPVPPKGAAPALAAARAGGYHARVPDQRGKGAPMKFLVSRASQGAVSKGPPCQGAVRGPEASAWPGEYQWFIELSTLEDLLAFLDGNGRALGLFAPEEGEP